MKVLIVMLLCLAAHSYITEVNGNVAAKEKCQNFCIIEHKTKYYHKNLTDGGCKCYKGMK